MDGLACFKLADVKIAPLTTVPAIRWWYILTRFALITGGIALAVLVGWGILRLFPDLRPGGERFIFRERDGDTFRHQPGFVRPPDGNRVLEDFIRRKDQDGFRLPRMTADHYPIVALGDSFTEGGETNWVDVLAEELDIPVRNLGWRGWGPLHQAKALRQFGDGDHTWILIGYFEGNDLSNIQTAYEELQASGAISIARNTDQGVGAPVEIVTAPDGNYLYPLQHFIGEKSYEIAYISDYLWWLNGSLETYQNSRNLALLRQALQDIQSMAGNACVGLVYIPSKEHIYFPFADPNGNRRYVLENGLALQLNADGWLTFGDLSPQDYTALAENLDHQREAVRQVVAELGLAFIDLTPPFLAHARTGELTYYVYDSHWNADGHRLAGQIVAEHLRRISTCPLSD